MFRQYVFHLWSARRYIKTEDHCMNIPLWMLTAEEEFPKTKRNHSNFIWTSPVNEVRLSWTYLLHVHCRTREVTWYILCHLAWLALKIKKKVFTCLVSTYVKSLVFLKHWFKALSLNLFSFRIIQSEPNITVPALHMMLSGNKTSLRLSHTTIKYMWNSVPGIKLCLFCPSSSNPH